MTGDQNIYQPLANQMAAEYNIPPAIFSAQIAQESSWNPWAIGSSGEIGLTQLKPSTAQALGGNAYDPAQNIAMGAQYLSQQFQKYGNWTDALSAYNSGYPASQSTAGANYASTILQSAGYDLQNKNSFLPSWLQGILPGAGLPAGTTLMTNGQPVGTVANTSASLPSIVQWLTGPGVVYVIAGVVVIAVGFYGIKAMFRTEQTQ